MPNPYYEINTDGISNALKRKAKVHNCLALAAHSQVKGITQDPRLMLKVLEILKK